MHVEICKDSTKWDAFVDSQPSAHNYHRWCWKEVIEQTFGHRGHYVTAVEGNAIRGILPLFDMRTKLFGHFLVSVPFFSYGGILADGSESTQRLLQEAVQLARELHASRIELRHLNAFGSWTQAVTKVTMGINLPRTPDDYLRTLSSGMRKKLRYACRTQLQAEWGGIELVSEFYTVFSANMRDLGTPVYPIGWFANQLQNNPGAIRILLLREGTKAVFAAFLSAFRDTLELPWAASLGWAREKYSQLALYWTFIEWAIQNGFRKMDLGRCTPHSGPHKFKQHWNCEERPLQWQYWLPAGAPVPKLRPDENKYQLAISLWKRLPLGVANALGPRIVRGLP